jgi:predicted transcriptional regulator
VSGWGERLVRQRTSLGLSQKEAAKRLGVDPSTLAKWERGERKPAGLFLGRVKRFLGDGGTEKGRSPRRSILSHDGVGGVGHESLSGISLKSCGRLAITLSLAGDAGHVARIVRN